MPEQLTYLKENVSAGELAVYEVLNSGLAAELNAKTSILVLPQALEVDTANRTLTLPLYEGETFDNSWDVANGGSPMGLRLAKDIPKVLKDLAGIDPAPILLDETLSRLPNIAFDYDSAKQYFGKLALGLKERKLLTESDLETVSRTLDFEQTSKLIINNGDFYPRNFIKLATGRVVLIDWETWNPHSPFYIVDHPENIAAVAYVHMWGNPVWQASYITELDSLFGFSEQAFQKGVAIKALTMAHFFGKYKELLKGQIRIIKSLV